jgi:hypothetical protein
MNQRSTRCALALSIVLVVTTVILLRTVVPQ